MTKSLCGKAKRKVVRIVYLPGHNQQQYLGWGLYAIVGFTYFVRESRVRVRYGDERRVIRLLASVEVIYKDFFSIILDDLEDAQGSVILQADLEVFISMKPLFLFNRN
ncbi:hypothetical protein SUGI_0983620 [Cryptomeria japonica]|nr:hypothetical protein SUGI_0983620 [Cryptomeria japonica]